MAIDTTLPVFSFMPDWSDVLNERLEFQTDAIPVWSGKVQTRATRITPRRSIEFLCSEQAQAAQWQANMAWKAAPGRLYLPLWTEGETLQADMASGSAAIGGDVSLLDFNAGDVVMLRGESPRQFELVELDAIASDHFTLANPTVANWPAGTAVLPVRRARMDANFTTSSFTRGMHYGRQRFIIDQANPYPAALPATTYRAFPVITTRPSFGQDPELALERNLERVDDDVGLIAVHDPIGIPLYRQEHNWNLFGRDQLASFRRMVYGLHGARNSVWMPTWRDDLTMVTAMASGSVNLVVAWCGYVDLVALAINRRDLRIELTDGTVLYRRVASAAAIDDDKELLVLDASLGVAVTVDQVAQISYMGLCRSDSDIFEFAWWTGDYAEVTTAWRARKHDI